MSRINNNRNLTACFTEYDENGEEYEFMYVINGETTYICDEDGSPLCILDREARIDGRRLIQMVRNARNE